MYRDENGNGVAGKVCHLGQLLTVIATNVRYPDRVLIVATRQGMGWTFVSNLTRRTGVRQR